MYEALSSLADVVPLVSGGVSDALTDRAYLRVIGDRWGTYLPDHALSTAWRRGRIMTRRVVEARVDVLLAVAASTDLAFLGGSVPAAQVSDTTLAAIRGCYPQFTHLSPALSPQAELVSRRANRRVSHSFAATQWAADALIRDDGFSPKQVTVAPFGPAAAPPTSAARPDFDPRAPRLLAVCSEWYRKGGDRAVAAFVELQSRVPEATLDIVGEAPSGLPEGVTPLGRLSRDDITVAYRTHDVLLELARSNASGVTITDAAAFGLPVLTTDVGGVSSIVQHDETGILLKPDPGLASAAAMIIEQWCTDPSALRRLSEGALARSRRVLNWPHWAFVVSAGLSELAAGSGAT